MAGRMPQVPRIPFGAIVTGIVGTGALAGAGYLTYNSIFNVRPGELAIIFNRVGGLRDTVLGAGTHVVIPWLEWPIIFDSRTRPRAIKSVTGTKDLQMVDIGLRVLTHPDPSNLPTIYRRLGRDYDDKVLPSVVNEVVKQIIAQYNATALLTQREQVSRKIKEQLEERAREFHIILEDVSITDLKFGRDFERAVEEKQVAQQEAERARFIVEKAQQDKLSTIIRAQGEARSAEMIGRAIAANPGFVQLRRIEAAKDIAKSIANSANSVYLPADTLMLTLSTLTAPATSGTADASSVAALHASARNDATKTVTVAAASALAASALVAGVMMFAGRK